MYVILTYKDEGNRIKMKALEWSQNHTIGFLQALEIMENWKFTEKSSLHGIIMEFEKNTPE